tara:strand:- start:346 stop:525 length:180 start_codon:yes stop_codon:yes gene_type:complete
MLYFAKNIKKLFIFDLQTKITGVAKGVPYIKEKLFVTSTLKKLIQHQKFFHKYKKTKKL